MVAEQASFTGASRLTGMSPPAVTRAIQQLELHLGTRLFHRNTRAIRLTDTGLRFHAQVKRLLADIADTESSITCVNAEPKGQISVTAPAAFGRMFITPLVTDFLVRHPGMTARTLLTDRVVDLIDEGIDLAVRIAHLPDSSLRASKVGTVRRVVCASPAYLAEHGTPDVPDDLQRLKAIDMSAAAPQQQWAFSIGGKQRMVRPPTRMSANTVEMTVAAAVAGLGVARLLSYQIDSELRSGKLKVILDKFAPPAVPVHVVHADGLVPGSGLQAFVEFAVQQLRASESLRSSVMS